MMYEIVHKVNSEWNDILEAMKWDNEFDRSTLQEKKMNWDFVEEKYRCQRMREKEKERHKNRDWEREREREHQAQKRDMPKVSKKRRKV